ncbi:unnamed protein product [Heligmosomoides polygyrus]|uniref:Uncharacterized protein n=1 Tax=Heligmosomoides polygyrus TaxID=6339 RepID=A0A183GA66_HELPZ|nr:unnamed protein product [Heligmosomoides polygyrus]
MLSERPSGQGAAQCCGFCLYTVAERADGQGKRRSANTSAESTRLAGHFTPPAARALRDAERIRRRCQQKTAAVVRERREGDQPSLVFKGCKAFKLTTFTHLRSLGEDSTYVPAVEPPMKKTNRCSSEDGIGAVRGTGT